MTNPFKKVIAHNNEAIIEQAFRGASKEADKKEIEGDRLEKAYQKEGIRIKYTANYMYNNLLSSVDSFPNLDRLIPVYKELVKLIINIDDLDDDLRSLRWVANQIKGMQMNYLKRLKKCHSTNECRDIRKVFYGRASSFLNKYKRQMKELYVVSRDLRDLPDLENIPTVIIAGAPNVGKSSLLKCLTGARPEIQPYPFTTKGLMLGFREFRFKRIQFIDTPGLLDRPLEQRNNIEMQAIVALKHLADVIVFVFDVTETCGYNLDEQTKMFKEIKEMFKKKIIVVANKSDIKGMRKLSELKEKHITVSCETKKGIDDLVSEIEKHIGGIKNE